VKSATLGIALAWILAAGCSGAGVDTVAGSDDAPTGTADALVELPPAPSAMTNASRSPDGWVLGRWNWGAPCRVSVHESVGASGVHVDRTFTIDVTASEDGYVMSFDDIAEVTAGRTEDVVADALYRNLAVLPSMRLDADGRFVEFSELHTELAELARRADVASADGVALMLARQPVVGQTILDRTMLAWFGFWLDHDSVPVDPDHLEGERSRPGPAGTWRWSTETSASPLVGDQRGPDANAAVRLTHTERAIDAESARVDAIAIVGSGARRPSYVELAIDGFTSGGLAVFAEQDRRIVTFDWENAEGCE
jgi:hypothetical protein